MSDRKRSPHVAPLVMAALQSLGKIDLTTPRSQFVARSTLAAGLALATAFALQVEAPFSAASTVLLVTNPNQGAVLAKGG
jgi:uncharacterized membrane protein YccC